MTTEQKKFQHLDAAESVFAQRELEHVEKQVYETRYPNLQLLEFVPANTSMPSWAQAGVYYQYDMFGIAKFIDAYGQGLPRVDVKKTEYTWRAFRAGDAYGYTIDDLKAAAALGMPLDASKAKAARRAFEELLDSTGFSGDSARGLVGFNALTNTVAYTVANGAAGSQTWSTKTPDEIVFDVTDCIGNMIESSSGVAAPDTVLLPIRQYNLIASKRMGDGSDVTILKHLLDTRKAINPAFDIKPWWRLNGAGAAGADRMIVYRRSPEVVEMYVPEPFNAMPPRLENLEYVIDCTGKIGSVVCRAPFEVCYADGI